MRVWLNLRYTVHKRTLAYISGLERHGYKVCQGLPSKIGNKDILVSWNRVGQSDRIASQFQAHNRPVLITENASWGNGFLGNNWYTIARNYHNTKDCADYRGPERWDGLGFELLPFRAEGETVILPQRGIGSPPVAMPKSWLKGAKKRYGGRVRPHPGKRPYKPLEADLRDCGRVITWGSGAAIKALMWGIPVISDMPNWIGEQDNTERGRLEMFRRLAWAQWTLDEIASGEAFDYLL